MAYLTVHPKEQYFGLGEYVKVDMIVTTPNGDRHTYKQLNAGRRYKIVQGWKPQKF